MDGEEYGKRNGVTGKLVSGRTIEGGTREESAELIEKQKSSSKKDNDDEAVNPDAIDSGIADGNIVGNKADEGTGHSVFLELGLGSSEHAENEDPLK